MDLYKARSALEEIDKDIESLVTLRELIAEAIQKIDTISNIKKIHSQEISLKGYMLIYDSYVKPIAPYIDNIHSNPTELGGIEEYDKNSLILGLKDDWQSFELSTLLGSLSHLNNVVTLNNKLNYITPDYRYKKGQTRYSVFNKAKIHYYLDKNEELKISKLHISSPGIVEFITSNFADSTYIVALIISLHQLPNYINKIMSLWFKYKKEMLNIRKMEREDKTNEIVSRFIDNEIQQHLSNDEMNSEAINNILQSIKNISINNKLAKSDVLLEKTLSSLSALSNLDKRNKYHVVHKRIK